MRNLLEAGQIDLSDFLARADALGAVGKTVLISDYFEYYRLAAYLTQIHHGPDRGDHGRGEPPGPLQRKVLHRT